MPRVVAIEPSSQSHIECTTNQFLGNSLWGVKLDVNVSDSVFFEGKWSSIGGIPSRDDRHLRFGRHSNLVPSVTQRDQITKSQFCHNQTSWLTQSHSA
jgi:hypothetical protein